MVLRPPADAVTRGIPAGELETYRTTCDEAIGLALLDRVPAGRRILHSALRRAMHLATGGQPWGRELALRYRRTLARYENRWGAPPPA